ncbi:hypothetical protein [Treponema putidum]|uniref:Uncharacterized protein n=1 Tax=Treponema putidum TaxID=221027 RepID=A0ABY5HY93_9SPIR|nr:hypothetical protein [Treponema putidum]UTY29131.1 hypothetical protein E4N76_09185 [Treponema putidum]
MAIITDEMIKQVYIIADSFYHGKISKQDALDTLHDKYGMTKNSAAYYINVYCSMRNGKRYTRTINKTATKYFLQQILKNNDKAEFRKALNAIRLHLEYYESLEQGKLPSIKKIIEEYSKLK